MTAEQNAVVCLDVGGTEIKAAPVGLEGVLLSPIHYFPADSGRGKEELLTHFAQIVLALARQVEGIPVTGVHLAFPGPFDYEKGISLMQGLDKYDALYGVDLRQELLQRLSGAGLEGLEGKDIRFINDVSAFALGEMYFGNARDAEKAMFICIGTGCGSAFGVEGRLADESTPGVPPKGYVYPVPFLDSCIDDYLSKRGLLRLTREMLGEPLEGKELAQRVHDGDTRAQQCFLRFGERIRDAMAPFLREFQPQCLCLGGQITKSGPLFLGPLRALCQEQGVNLHITADTSQKAIQGLSRLSLDVIRGGTGS